MDLFHTPSAWTTQPVHTEQPGTAYPDTGDHHSPEHAQLVATPKSATLAAAGLVVALCCLGLVWFAIRPTGEPRTVVAPGPAHLTVAGLHGPVTLTDWPDGRRWLSWWKRNRGWAGLQIWADRPYQDFASCAAFVQTIICVNFDPKVLTF